ncbi:uncharacterized protein LOC117928135 [Vitis riparia]|uniref:uncharacterized protein LOC117928135 n=1 Tax=Vitis riparia TaxID=96939 RepID=UPI00155B0BE8|nr:uncharacterized protein LOC117928135 [Vitis riparia]
MIERETIKYHSTVIIMQEGHKLNLIRWKMCFWTILCSCIIRNPVNEILLTKNQRRIDCNTVSKFQNNGINTFLGLRFLHGMMQGIDTFSKFFEISKCDLSVLMRGQLSSMLLKIAVYILDGHHSMGKKCFAIWGDDLQLLCLLIYPQASSLVSSIWNYLADHQTTFN